MRKQECSRCNCNKSLHRKHNKKDFCYGCAEVYWDNRSEYYKADMNAYHTFKLDNLKWLEEQYEKTM